MEYIKIVIADDHRLFREGLRFVIENQPGLKVTKVVCNGEELIASLRTEQPDIVIMDLKMPVMDGIEAIQKIRSEGSDVQIIVMSMHHEEAIISQIHELGANRFLVKNSSAEKIVNTIQELKRANS